MTSIQLMRKREIICGCLPMRPMDNLCTEGDKCAIRGKGKIKLSVYRPWRPLGLQEFEAPTFSDTSAHRWRQDCQPYAPADFYPQEDSWYSFLLEVESTPGP
jgi:hypothetical protein